MKYQGSDCTTNERNQVETMDISDMEFDQLALKLINYTHIPHQYFEIGSLFLRNVSSSEDSLQEYRVYKKDNDNQYIMVESYTVSWIDENRLAYELKRLHNSRISDLVAISSWPNEPAVISQEAIDKYKKEFVSYAALY